MNIGSEIIWLSEHDVSSLLTMEEAIQAVESAFLLYGQKKVQMPPKIYLEFNPFGGDLRTMPAYLQGDVPAAGVKIVNSNANNPKRNLPAVSGVMVVVDPETGLILSVMAAGSLTAIRTGAAGAIAAKYLARPESSVLGLIGCGKQAATQLEAIKSLFKIKEVKVWGQTIEESKNFCDGFEKNAAFSLKAYAHPKDICEADIIVTTTPVRTPLIEAAWVNEGTHINAIGADAPGKQELSIGLLKKAKVFVDEWGQASHGGEINMAVSAGLLSQSDLGGELGDIISKNKSGRTDNSQITIFDSTGLAIQDVSVAQIILKKAQKINKGQVLKFNG